MTTMMDWEASPGGSASGSSSLNGHSETDEDTITNCRSSASNLVTTLNLKLNNNNSSSSSISSSGGFGDKKSSHHNNHHYNYFPPAKENSLILNDGFNGLNLNPSPPAPVRHQQQDLSTSSSSSSSTTINFSLPLPRSPINSGGVSKGGGGQSGPLSGNSGSSGPHFSSSSSSNNTTTKKHKPIPPPLDLSIGASSLISSSSSSSIGSASFQYPGTFYSPYYLGSPKFNQAEKSLPLRKRWHSWSPKLMNSNEDLIPLYTESPSERSTTNPPGAMNGKGSSNGHEAHSTSINSQYGGHKSNGTLQPPPYSMHVGRNGQGSSGGNATSQSGSLQTPTPFYTPNEPSPRFMNSPVFSYSTPDTTLYQGPYSPIRTTSLYPPGSPFLNSNLNTPTFVITNLSPPTSTNGSSSTPTVGLGASSAGSNSSSTSSSSSSVPPSIPTVILGGGNSGYNTPFPFLSPASSSQASSNHSYEDDSKYSNVSLPVNPIWNIFLAGTKVRFLSDAGQNTGWYLVDYLSQLSDLSLVLGFGLKGDYAPHGFSVKQYVVTSSARERVQITFNPINNEQLRHPNIEADCEAGHPFLVLKKGIAAVKPEGFTATYGSHCMKLEVLDVCVKQNYGGIGKSNQQQHHHQQHQHQSHQIHHPPTSVFLSNGMSSTPVPNGIRNGYGGIVTTSSSNSMSRLALPAPPPPPPLNAPQALHPAVDDMKPSLSDLKHNFLGDGKPSWRDVEDIKPFALPIPLAMIPATHHSPPDHHPHSSSHHRHSPSQQHHLHHHHPSSQQHHHSTPHHQSPQHYLQQHQHQLDIQIKQEDFGSSMETEPSPPLHYDPGPKKPKSKSKKKKKESNNSGCSSPSGEPKGRRPMNAFLVYAKEKRPLLIQMYPGKDNRSISTLLGDSWKTLDPEEKNFYIKTAKDSADEQKKLHPDCWKRKRTQQQSQQSQSSSPIPMKMEALTRVMDVLTRVS